MHEHHDAQPKPSWDEFFDTVGCEEWLTAKALLDLDPHHVVRRDAERWLRYSDHDGYRDETGNWRQQPELPWEEWVADVDNKGRSWSSSEWRLYEVVAGLTTGRPFNIVGVLDHMGSWESGVWEILTEWGTGGDNRMVLGRSTVFRRS
jgi:hypothetical protein